MGLTMYAGSQFITRVLNGQIYDTKAHLERQYLLRVGPQNSRTKEDTFIYNTWSCLTYMYEG